MNIDPKVEERITESYSTHSKMNTVNDNNTIPTEERIKIDSVEDMNMIEKVQINEEE